MIAITRRKFLGTSLGSVGLVGLSGFPLRSLAEKDHGSLSKVIYDESKIPFIGMTEDGPLYPPEEIPWLSDLTSTGNSGVAKGSILYLFGSILDRQGRPLENAEVEIWHTDYNGNYRHPRGWGQDNLDPNFAYFAKVKTNKQGFYIFKTIRPRWYFLSGLPGSYHKNIPRAAHIHIKIRHRDHGVLTTEAYFDNASHAEVAPTDLVFLSRPKRVRDIILLAENKASDYSHLDVDFDSGAICCRYDMAFLL